MLIDVFILIKRKYSLQPSVIVYTNTNFPEIVATAMWESKWQANSWSVLVSMPVVWGRLQTSMYIICCNPINSGEFKLKLTRFAGPWSWVPLSCRAFCYEHGLFFCLEELSSLLYKLSFELTYVISIDSILHWSQWQPSLKPALSFSF